MSARARDGNAKKLVADVEAEANSDAYNINTSSK